MTRLLITGASGQLGAYLLQSLSQRDIRAVAWGGEHATTSLFGFPLKSIDLNQADSVAAAFRDVRPCAVIHAAAVSRIDTCHRDPVLAEQVNTRGTEQLVALCRESKCRLVYVSTDLVFDGCRGAYAEQDSPAPVSVYGRTKAAAEPAVLAYERGAVVRISLLFGPSLTGRPNFFTSQIQALTGGNAMRLFVDEWRTPLGFPTAASSLITVARSDFAGLLHLGGPDRLSRWEMGARLASAMGRDDSVFVPARQADIPSPEPRPHDVSLDSRLFRAHFPGEPWPDWSEAIRAMGLALG